MNVIDGQAGLVIYSSLIFYSLTIDNILNIIILLILAGVTITTLTGDNGLLNKSSNAKEQTKIGEEKEGVGLAVTNAQIGDEGYQELAYDNLQNAITKQFGNQATVVDNGDGTFTVLINDRAYDISNSGNIEQGINWNLAKQNAKAPDEQVKIPKNVIGIGTDGKTVNMDFWEYNFDDVTSGYGLNDTSSLTTETSKNASKGYSGTNFSNIIIPQYISDDNGETWTPVTNLDWTFFNCAELAELKKIPNTVKSMRYTFRGCTSLSKVGELPNKLENMLSTFMGTPIMNMPTIPENVNNMRGTFNGCSSLNGISSIPQGVTNMSQTFYNCINLTVAPEIPNGVIDLSSTFFGCSNLTTMSGVIPNSVTTMNSTFRGCSNLTGTITINANWC